MRQRPRILDILARSQDPAADLALAAGLPFVGAELQCHIVDILLGRGEKARLENLPDVFDRLAPEAQRKVVANTARLFGALRVSVRESAVQTRLNCLNIIRRSQNPRLAYLAAACVHDGSHHIRAEAAQTLRELTELHCANHDETAAMLREAADGTNDLGMPIAQTLRLLRDERQQLVAAIRDALSRFDNHHRPEVLEAAMFLAEELEDGLFQADTVKRGKLTQAMLDVYSQSPSPRLAAFTYISLKYPELRRRVVVVLSNLKNPDFFSEFIRHHWLVKDPRIQSNLPAIRTLNWLNDGIHAAFTMTPQIAAMTPSWLISLGLPVDQKVQLLTNFLLIDNPAANLAAAWALVQIHTPSACLALQGAVDHEDPRIRAIAEHECRHRRRAEKQQVRQVRTNRPQDWSELLDRSGLSETFEDFWLHFERLPPVLAKTSGAHAIRFLPGFQTQLQVKLIAQIPADRLRALKMLRDMNVVDRFCKEVFSMANDPAPEIRAAATRALGALADPTSRRILERALADASPSVQAAAIESLDQLGLAKRAELLLPKTASDDAEVRGAAVLALLRMHVPKAAQALVAMLADNRVDHRCHALWIIEQLRLVMLAPKVGELAANDPDSRIARIAQQVMRRLERDQKAPPANRSAQPSGVAAPLAVVPEGRRP